MKVRRAKIVQRKKTRTSAGVALHVVPRSGLFTLPLALRCCVLGHIEFHEVACLVRVASAFRGIVSEYVTSATEVTLVCENQDEIVQRLALSLLERHARSLRSIIVHDETDPSVVSKHSESMTHIITRNAATLRYVPVNTLETYLAACACPNLYSYHPFNHGITTVPFNRHSLHTATVACRNITHLTLDEQHLQPLTIDRILSADSPLSLVSLDLSLHTDYSCIKRITAYFDTLRSLRVACSGSKTYVDSRAALYATLADVFPTLIRLGNFEFAVPYRKQTRETQKSGMFATPVIWRLSVLETLKLENVESLEPFEMVVPQLLAFVCDNTCAVVFSDIVKNAPKLHSITRSGSRRMPLVNASGTPMSAKRIVLEECDGRQLQNAFIPRTALRPLAMMRVAQRWNQLTTITCRIQQACVITQRAICDLLRNTPNLVSCKIFLHNGHEKTHAFASPSRLSHTLPPSPPVDRSRLVTFRALVPFEMFIESVRTPNLTSLNCCVARRLDETFRACLPSLTDLAHVCSLHNHSDHPSLVTSRLRILTLRCGSGSGMDGAGGGEAGSNVSTLRLGDSDLMIQTALSWCPRLHKLFTYFASEITFWELLRCGLSTPHLKYLSIGGTYTWPTVKPLLYRLVATFPRLEIVDCSAAEGFDEDEKQLATATISSIITRPFSLGPIDT